MFPSALNSARISRIKSLALLTSFFGFICVFISTAVAATAQLPANNTIRQILEGWAAGYSAQVEGEFIYNSQAIIVIYEERGFVPIWLQPEVTRLSEVNDLPAINSLSKNNKASQIVNNKKGIASIPRLTPLALELLHTLREIDQEGLNPVDYHLLKLQSLQDSDFNEALDLLLTDAFLTLAQHLLAGKVDPEKLTSDWKSQRENIDPKTLIAKLNNQPLKQILDSLKPRQPRYNRLIKSLARLKALPSDNWPALALTPVIKPDQQDERLTHIAKRLRIWGDLNSAEPTEYYNDEMKQAVIRFQSRHGLEADGVIGKNTFLALNFSPAQRANQIIVNLERWRWLDQNMGDFFVVVNIANFDLRVYRAGKKVMEMPVIVGRNFRKTPVFSDRIRYLVLNPTWTVPQKLAVQDKLPEIKKDVSYLSKYGFSLYELGSNNIVDPKTVDWQRLNKRFPYRLVQAPGPLNALGQVKFMFPNEYDVYLHDTSAKELFNKSERAFSSGCIRVSQPLELTELLLQPLGITKEKINQILSESKTQTINLKQAVPVHIEYWTAWVDSSDVLQFRVDIYERDNALLQALKQPLL